MNKQLTKNFAPGHGTCSGCGIPAIVRNILDVSEDPVVVVNATGCLEVTSTLYPYTAWKVPYIHNAFENAGATVSGIEAAYKVLEKKGKVKGKINFVVFGGDGSTYDIGLQALSGALERGHRFLYVAYDNQGYMNTGGQRSGATPYGANMTTTPAAKGDIGNELDRKDIMEIVAAHGVKYLAQANVFNIEDMRAKAKKAFETDGPSFLLVLQPCTNSWKFPVSDYVKVAKLAHDTNYWTLYEIENGQYKINQYISNPKPIEEFLKTQKRFKHLLLPENKKALEKIQRDVDFRLEKLKKKTGE
ncbi:MAG: thiamine pyrophosphate-dependent enzyme [Candidatus Moranbacteria bacterium]|nr:thiamine pyrophosphate-dependent enzyme [Candidatus Moranbacteria bacterium]